MPQLNVLPINVSKSVDLKGESAVSTTSSSKDDFSQYLSKSKGDSSYRNRETDNRLDDNTFKKFRKSESVNNDKKTEQRTDEASVSVKVTDSANNTPEVAAAGKKTGNELAKESLGEENKLPDESELLMSFLVKADQTLVVNNAVKSINIDELSASQKAKSEAQLLLKSSDLVANLSDIAKALKPNSELKPTTLSEQELLAKTLLESSKVSKEKLEVIQVYKEKEILEGKGINSIALEAKVTGKENLEKLNVDNNNKIVEELFSKGTKASDNTIGENFTGDSKKLTESTQKTIIQSFVNTDLAEKSLSKADEENSNISLKELDSKVLDPEIKNVAASKVNPVISAQVNVNAQTPLDVEISVDEQVAQLAQLAQNSNGIATQGADLTAATSVIQNSNGKNSPLGVLSQTPTEVLNKENDSVESEDQLNAKSVESLIDQSKEFSSGENKDGNNKVVAKTTPEFSVNSNFVDVTGRATQVAQQIAEQQAADVFNPTGSSEVSQSQKTNAQLHQETISIFRKDFSDAVKDKVMLMISQKLQQFDITLDPPELGNMHVRVNLQGEQATVNFVVQNQQAKEALEQNMHKLKELLAEQGVDVGDANVEQQSNQGDFEENNEEKLADNQQSLMTNTADASDAVEHNLSAKMINSATTVVDYYA